jgi:acetylornithine deacetylase/succinyl-diaminopimelate desuccinylase-like protein
MSWSRICRAGLLIFLSICAFISIAHAVGSRKAAAVLAARFKGAGFPDQDVFVGGPQPDKMNIVVRFHGRGKYEVTVQVRLSTRYYDQSSEAIVNRTDGVGA